MDLTEKTLTRDYRFTGQIINLRVDEALLPNGVVAEREVVEHPGGVCVAALTQQGELLFVRQFRYPYQRVILELPAGKLSPGEDPAACGHRELREETGYEAEEFYSLGVLYPSPGYCGEVIHMYAARVTCAGEADPDEDEFLEVEHIPLQTAVDMVLNNQIEDAKTQAAVLKLYLLMERGVL